MARERIDIDVNMGDATSKRALMAAIAPLDGLYDVSIKPVRVTRSNAANRFMWGVVVKLYAQYLTAVNGEIVDAEEAFLDLKRRFLKRIVINKETGVVEAVTVKRSSLLTKDEFSEFIENSIQHLQECRVTVPPPEMYGVELHAAAGSDN